MPGEYSGKYMTKGVPKRGTKGDVVLAGLQPLQPENAVTMGVFQRMYNHVNQKGPIPIFNVVHNNFDIPLTFKNFNTKSCSVLGISKLRSSNQDTDEDTTENEEYVNPSLLDKFDRRWDEVVQTGKDVKEEEFRKDISLREFCDRFESKICKIPETNDRCLHLTIRRETFSDIHHPIRLIPHLSTARANPKSAKYWMYCKHLCLWLTPCKVIKDILPNVALTDKDLENYWIDRYNELWRHGALLPNWVKRHHQKYCKDEDSSSDENDTSRNIPSVENNVYIDQEVSHDSENDDDLDGDPRARRQENPFYQNIEEQIHLRSVTDPDLENDDLSHLINISNPRGADFMAWSKNMVLPNYNQIMKRLHSLKNVEAVSDNFIPLNLNNKQKLFKDLVNDYVQKWALAKEGNGEWPKALRLILCGNPGTGKSSVVKDTMNALGKVLGVNYAHVVKQATPTGCAAFQLASGATTVHRLFGLHLKSKRDDIDDKTLKMLLEKFKHGICLLVIDEMSMEARSMMGLIISRLRNLHIDLNSLGFILIGDPSQLLPIAGEPLWSLKMKRSDLKDLNEDSIAGLVDFRSLFRMPKLENIPNFDEFKAIESLKLPNEKQRKLISEFTAAALEGDYYAVYLTEVKRAIEGDELSHEFISELVPSCRYGNIKEKNLLRMKEVFASEDDIVNDESFLEARMIHGYHYFSENNPARKSVESENVRQMFDTASRLGGRPIVHIKSGHMPQNKRHLLEQVSAKEFQGMLKDFVAFENLPIMLLENISPQLNLFNGSICKFKGLLYLSDNITVKLRSADFRTLQVKNLVTCQELDLKGMGASSRLYKIPKDSVIVAINNMPVSSDNDIKMAFENTDKLDCEFSLSKSPPHLPDFIIIQSDEYKERGGPNILGCVGTEDLIPIPCKKIKREGREKSKKYEEFRLGYLLEPALAVTGYKLQGRNETCAKIHIKEFSNIPGLFHVCISRTKHPKKNFIPPGQWPTTLDINLQRLNPFVIEAEIFERVIKIMSNKTLRNYTVETGRYYGETWDVLDIEIAECMELAIKHGFIKKHTVYSRVY